MKAKDFKFKHFMPHYQQYVPTVIDIPKDKWDFQPSSDALLDRMLVRYGAVQLYIKEQLKDALKYEKCGEQIQSSIKGFILEPSGTEVMEYLMKFDCERGMREYTQAMNRMNQEMREALTSDFPQFTAMSVICGIPPAQREKWEDICNLFQTAFNPVDALQISAILERNGIDPRYLLTNNMDMSPVSDIREFLCCQSLSDSDAKEIRNIYQHANEELRTGRENRFIPPERNRSEYQMSCKLDVTFTTPNGSHSMDVQWFESVRKKVEELCEMFGTAELVDIDRLNINAPETEERLWRANFEFNGTVQATSISKAQSMFAYWASVQIPFAVTRAEECTADSFDFPCERSKSKKGIDDIE